MATQTEMIEFKGAVPTGEGEAAPGGAAPLPVGEGEAAAPGKGDKKQENAAALEACRVTWTNRAKQSNCEMFCAALFYIQVIMFIVVFILVLASGNRKTVSGNCTVSDLACLNSACGDGYVHNPFEMPLGENLSTRVRDIPCLHEDVMGKDARDAGCSGAFLVATAVGSPDATFLWPGRRSLAGASSGEEEEEVFNVAPYFVARKALLEHAHTVEMQLRSSSEQMTDVGAIRAQLRELRENYGHRVREFSRLLLEKQHNINGNKLQQEDHDEILRRVLSSHDNDDKVVWDSLAAQWHVPFVMFLTFFALLGAWAYGWYKAPLQLIFVTLFIGGIVLPAFVAGYAGDAGMVLLLLPGIVVIALCVYMYKSMQEAANAASSAIVCLAQTGDVLAVSVFQFCIFGLFIVLWLLALIETGNWVEWKVGTGESYDYGVPNQAPTFSSTNCNLQKASGATTSEHLLAICFFPLTIFLRNVVLIVCSAGVGKWYFHDEKMKGGDSSATVIGAAGTEMHAHHYAGPAPASAGRVAFGWAYTNLAGANMFVSIILSITYEIKRRAARFTTRPWCVCVFGIGALDLLCFLFWYCVAAYVEAFTKYFLIAHTMKSEGGICATATKVKKTLDSDPEKKSGGFVLQDKVLDIVFMMQRLFLAYGLGLLTWIWIDNEVDAGLFSNSAPEFIFIFLLSLLLLLCIVGFGFGPIAGLVLLIFVADWIDWLPAHGFMAGIFVGCVCSIAFEFATSLVSYTATAILYCLALFKAADKEPHFNKRASVNGLVVHKDELAKPLVGEGEGAPPPADNAAKLAGFLGTGGKSATAGGVQKAPAKAGDTMLDPATGKMMVAEDAGVIAGVPMVNWKVQETTV